MTLNCIHIFVVTGSFLYWCVMRPASQRFFIHSFIYLRILIISYLATFLGTNSLSVLMCLIVVNQYINQSINQSIYLIHHSVSFALPTSISSPNFVSTLLLPLVVFDMLALEFPPSSSQIYRLLHCLQIQSRNHLFFGASILWPQTISVHVLLIRHIMLMFASWNYVMLYYTHKHARLCMCVHMYVYVCMYVYVYMYVCVYICIYNCITRLWDTIYKYLRLEICYYCVSLLI